MTASPGPIVDACRYESSLWRTLAHPEDVDTRADEAASLLAAMDRAGVSAGLVVLDRELERVARAARSQPGRLFGLVHFDALDPARGVERVRACHEAHEDFVLGVATAFPCIARDPRLRAYAPLYEYCLRQGLPLVCRLGTCGSRGDPPPPRALGVLAAAYPRLVLICLNDGGELPLEIPDLLGRFSNLYLATSDWRSPTTGTLLSRLGSHRLLFASGGTWAAPLLESPAAALAVLPGRHRDNVCWRTAARLFGPRLLRVDRSTAERSVR